MRTIFLFCLVISLGLSSLWAQRLEPFGLQGKNVTCLATSSAFPAVTWRSYLFAGTDGFGVFARNLFSPDSDWVYLGLAGKKITALHLYHWGVGPGDFNTPFAGVEPDLTGGDSTLVYQYTTEGKWVPADSGIDHSQVQSIRAMDGFCYSGHEPPLPLFAFGNTHVYRLWNIGKNWERTAVFPESPLVLQINQKKKEVLVGGGWLGYMFAAWIEKSADLGTTWSELELGDYPYNAVLSLASHPNHPDTVYAGLRGLVMKTTNGGESWTETGLRSQPVYFQGLAIDSGNPDHLWAGGPIDEQHLAVWVSLFALWESYDGGKNWRDVPSVPYSELQPISTLASDPNEGGVIYIAIKSSGVWRYTGRSKPAGTIRVPEDFATIQAAIDASIDGDTVLVGPGKYTENIDFHGKGILLMSAEGADKTVIDGNKNGSVVTFASGEDSTSCIKGFTLRNGSGTLPEGGRLSGGGIYCFSSSPKIIRNVIAENVALAGCGAHGGGIAILGTSRPLIEGNRVTANLATSFCDALVNYGGGIYVSGTSTPRLIDNIITGNNADFGGGMAIQDSAKPIIQRNLISQNHPQGVWISAEAQPVIGGFPGLGNDIVSNEAYDRGQALWRAGHGEVINAQFNYFGACPTTEAEVYPPEEFNTSNCSARPVRSYFPMEIGNRWTFGTSFPLTEAIIDTATVAGLHFFRFDQFRGLEKPLLRLTEEGKLTWRLDPMSSIENVWVDFAAEVGDRWKVSDGASIWTVELQSKTDTVTVPAGTFTNCYRFWFDFGCCDNDWVEWYTLGIGPVKRILYGIGVIEYPLSSAEVHGIPVGVDKSPSSQAPTKFALQQNYPNPFNASTTIRYELPVSSLVTLEIYNLMGQKVRTLIAQRQQSGSHQAQWDGTDDAGQVVPSGIYVYRLSSRDWSINHKAILLR